MRPFDPRELHSAVDLWLCMWSADERERFETAVVRTLIDDHPPHTRLLALALCHVIATPRLLAAASRIAERGEFAADEMRFVEDATLPLFKLHDEASRLRGHVPAVEYLLARSATGQASPHEDALLDAIDVRDLVAVARTTLDARLFAEIERRVARRGRYQRGRVANVLGFRVGGGAREPRAAAE